MDGRFILKVHQEIIGALAGRLSATALRSVNDASDMLDVRNTIGGYLASLLGPIARFIGLGPNPEQHFDNESFEKGWAFVNESLGERNLQALGEGLHTVEDFYSHSNYAELAADFFGSGGPESIPTFDVAMTNPEFSEIWKNKGTSGYSDDSNTPEGKLSHTTLNKDNDTRPYHHLAKYLALVHSKKYLRMWKKQQNIPLTEEEKREERDEEPANQGAGD